MANCFEGLFLLAYVGKGWESGELINYSKTKYNNKN